MIILTSPGAEAFRIGSFSIYYYGICIAISIIVGFAISYLIAKKEYKEIDPDILFDVATVAIISGVVFARIYYCILNFGYYSNHFFEIFNLRQGGLSIQGGLLGGTIITALYCRLKKYPILKLADILSYGVIIAQIIGRWGNFFNFEAYGLPAKHGICVFIPENYRIAGYEFYKYFHPTFLYESILNIFVFLILFFIIKKIKGNINGLIFAYYLFLYSLIRFFVEGLRLDSIVNVGALHAPQIVCILTMLGSAIFIFYTTRAKKN